MTERSIDSFFTRTSTPKKKVAPAVESVTTVSISTAVDAAPAAAAPKRKRENEEVKVEDTTEDGAGDESHADKKVKRADDDGDSSASSSPSAPLLSAKTTTSTTASDGSTSTSSSHWATSLPSLLHPSWQQHLRAEFTKPYFTRLVASLVQASAKAQVFPPVPLIFNAFNLCPFPTVSVVILGQDPYHDNDQAEGLAFSVPPPLRPPSSLQNMYKELKADVGFSPPQHGSLRKWAEQGVLLLNTSLTVTAHQPLSHKGFGWETFTDAVVSALNRDAKGVVFLLWGSHAQKKAAAISQGRHFVLKAAHPSGLSAHRGFFGCRHFSQTNAILERQGKKPIDWQL